MKLFKRTNRLLVKDYIPIPANGPAVLSAVAAEIPAFDLSNMDIEFHAKKSINPMQPNSMKLQIYNQNPDHRRALENGKNRVILEAGYDGTNTQIFNGQARAAWSQKEGGMDWVTYVETGDSFMEVALAQINVNLGPSSTLGQTIKSVAGALRVKPGNLDFMLAKFSGKLTAMFGRKATVFGNAGRVMTDLCDSAGMEWSIQDGELQVTEKGQALEGTGVLLSSDPNTGLLDSPSLELKSAGSFSNPVQIAKSVALNNPGHLVTARSLINPGLRVGGKVLFDTLDVRGPYRILEMEYKGQSRGKEWEVKITCSRITKL